MCREFLRIGNFTVYSYGVLLLVGFLVALWIASRRAERYGISKEKITGLAIWMLLAGIVGARLLFVAQDWPSYANDFGRIANLREGGMTSFGGLLGGFIVLLIWCRVTRTKFVTVMDAIMPAVLIGIGFGRIGCFLNGCCYGSECDLPWAVTVHAEDGRTHLGHPAQLYKTLMVWTAAALLIVWDRRSIKRGGLKPGQIGAAGFVLFGIARFVYEMFRIGVSSQPIQGIGMTEAQVLSLAITLVALVWFIIASTRKTSTGSAAA
ncbi:MAG: Prolipoprotein diacylglyceryl transferase [Fimbriimonadales bacterium]|nr:Prolipoprotein diacylglyceryl transferase [Fimbriimonadales bacterium]